MTTTTNTNALRLAIEAAMRRRDPGVRVSVTPAAGQTLASVDGPSSALVWGSSMADTADEALRRLARGFGLRDDGSDPAAEVERLTRALHDVAERLECADYDDVVAAVSDALDEAEARDRDAAHALAMFDAAGVIECLNDALRDRDATIARLTAAVEASDAAVREYLAAEDAISASCDARDSATTTADADAAMSGSRSRIDRYHAARAALVAIDGGDHA